MHFLSLLNTNLKVLVATITQEMDFGLYYRSPRLSSWYPRNLLATRSRVPISARAGFFSPPRLVVESDIKLESFVSVRNSALVLTRDKDGRTLFAIKTEGEHRRRRCGKKKKKKKAPVFTSSCVTPVGSSWTQQ